MIFDMTQRAATPTYGMVETAWSTQGLPTAITVYGITDVPAGFFANYVSGSFGRGHFSLMAELPTFVDGLHSIGDFAFQVWNFQSVTLPSTLTGSIGNGAFNSCNILTSITFTSTPSSIDANAFSNCSRLTHIYVPWSEGAVANAPWGATAEVHYNS